MKWSKLKHIVEDRFSPSLGGRVAIFSTRYGNCTCGRAWITVDGKEVASFCTRAKANRAFEEELAERGLPPDPGEREPNVLLGHGELSRQDAYAACWAFIHELSIDQALADPDPLVQALAVLDSRTGKKRLSSIDPTDMHPLAKSMLLIRLDAEGLQLKSGQ